MPSLITLSSRDLVLDKMVIVLEMQVVVGRDCCLCFFQECFVIK